MYLSYPLPLLYKMFAAADRALLLRLGRSLRSFLISWPPGLSASRRAALIRLLRFARRCWVCPAPPTPRGSLPRRRFS